MSRIARAGLVLAAGIIGVLLAGVIVARPFGYRTIVVHGPSMGAAVPSGSLVVGRLVSPERIRVGDVIVVQEHQGDVPATPKVHRVVSIEQRDGDVVVTTKGDANNAPDPDPYLLPARTLRIIATVPLLGFVVRFVQSPLGWFLSIVAPSVSLAAVYLMRVWRKGAVPAPA